MRVKAMFAGDSRSWTFRQKKLRIFFFQGLASWSVMDQRTEDNLFILKSILETDETSPFNPDKGIIPNKVTFEN